MIRDPHRSTDPRGPRPTRAFRRSTLSPSPARIRSTLAAIVDQPDDLRALRDFHKTLADVNRLRIIRRLAASPATVTDLIAHVGLSQPLVSWHLGKLRLAGLVETSRNGRETICRLRADAFAVFGSHERRALGLDAAGDATPVRELAPGSEVAGLEGVAGTPAEAAS